jgi:hypothetical protein
MAKDRQELVHRALKNLGVLPQGQNPSAEEYNSVDALIEPMIEELIGRDIVFIESPEVFEDRFFLALGHVLAGQAAAEFGMQNDQAIAARMVKAEHDLEKIASTRPTYQTLEIMPY